MRVDDLVQRSQRGGLELHLGLLEHRDEASRGGEAQGGDHGDGAGYRHARTLLTNPSRYLSTPYAYARFHCGEISRRGHPLSYPFSVLNDQADRSRAVGLNWWGTRAR